MNLTKKVLLTTDCEKGINNATNLTPNLCSLLCSNYIHQDIKHRVQSHNGTSGDILVYTNHVM